MDGLTIISHAVVIGESGVFGAFQSGWPLATWEPLPSGRCYSTIQIYTFCTASRGSAGETMLPEIPAEQFATALDRCAEEVLAEARLVGPPVDSILLAARLGMVTAVDRQMQGRARFVRLARAGAEGTILIGPEPRRERRHWAVAHEIGEAVAHRVFAALGVSPSEAAPAAREMVANALAGRLLLPAAWFASDARQCDYDLAALKARYSTASHELIARRMLELSAPAILTVFDHGQITWRRTNLPGWPPRLSPAEASLWQAVHRDGHARHECGEEWTLRGWPVHEEGWRREILRTEISDDFS